MKTGKILIADDNRNVLSALSLFLPVEFEHVKTIQQPGRLIAEMELMDYDVVLLDMNFTSGQQTGNEGIFWLREIKSKFPLVEVVMFTAYGDVELAVKALKEGASDFVIKPWDNEKLVATLHASCRISRSNRELTGIKKKLFFWAVGLGLRYQPFGENGWFYEQKMKLAEGGRGLRPGMFARSAKSCCLAFWT